MDADLVAALGSSPTVTEKLYAEAIEDSRQRAAELNQYRADVKQMFAWYQEAFASLPPERRTEDQYMYERCLMKALDLRRQNMSTATSYALMDDVVNDAIYIAGKIYAHLKAREAEPGAVG